MQIQIFRNRKIYKEQSTIGNDKENKVETLEFKFPIEFEHYSKFIELEIEGKKYVDTIQDDKYIISRNLTKQGTIYAQIVFKENEENDCKIFKSNIFELKVDRSINATEEITQEQKPDVILSIQNDIQDIKDKLKGLNTGGTGNIENIKANNVFFEDGETFQEKYNQGKLKGQDGLDGKDGYTPQKGTDYWTNDDIAEINEYIDNIIGIANATLENRLAGGGNGG